MKPHGATARRERKRNKPKEKDDHQRPLRVCSNRERKRGARKGYQCRNTVGPLLKLSDLESVEKQLPARSRELFLASECVGSLSKIYLGVFPVSRGTPIQETADRTFSTRLGQIRPDWVKYDPNARSDRKKRIFRSDPRSPSCSPRLDRESADGEFLQPGPSRSEKYPQTALGENSDTL